MIVGLNLIQSSLLLDDFSQRGINDPLSKQDTDNQSFKRLKSLAWNIGIILTFLAYVFTSYSNDKNTAVLNW